VSSSIKLSHESILFDKELQEKHSVEEIKNSELYFLHYCIRNRGGTIVKTITKPVSHIILDPSTCSKERIADMYAIIKASEHYLHARPWIVSNQWLVECLQQQTLLDETPFLIALNTS
jgi:hypothetical protein